MELRNKTIAILSAFSIMSYTLENFIPYPLVFLRIGIGNAFIVSAFYLTGIKGAFVVLFMKLLVGSILSGRFLTPFFFFSLSGGILSFVVMSTIFWFKRIFSPVGLSVAGGVFHNLGQMFILFLYYGYGIVEKWFLLLWYLGIFSGLITGIIALYVIRIDIEKWLEKKISTIS